MSNDRFANDLERLGDPDDSDAPQPERPLLAEDKYVIEELSRLKNDLAVVRRERDEARYVAKQYHDQAEELDAVLKKLRNG